MDQQHWQDPAERMARKQEEYLLNPAVAHEPTHSIPHAVSLARDYLRYLHRPERTVSFVLAFHPTAQRWAAWASWATALDLALEASAVAGTPRDCITLLNARSQAARELNEYSAAQTLGQQALQLAEDYGDPQLVATTHNKLGLLALRQDDLTLARDEFTRACAIGAEHVPDLELGHFTINLGTVAARQQDFVAAEQAFQQALQHYSVAGAELAVAKVQCNLVDLRQRMGQLQTMPPELLAARDLFKARQFFHEYGQAENAVGYIHYHLREWDAAERAYRRAITAFDQIGGLAMKTIVLTNLVALFVATRDWSSAERYVEQGYQLAELCDQPLARATLKYDQGQMLVAQGRIAEARTALQEALTGQRACGACAEAEQTQQLLDSLDGDGSLLREAP